MKKKENSADVKAIDKVMEKLGALSRTQRILISSGILVLIIGFFIGLSFWPKFQKYSELDKQVQDLRAQVAKAKKEADRLDGLRVEANKQFKKYSRETQFLPDQREIPGLLTSISRAIVQSHLDSIIFTPQPETTPEESLIVEMPVSLEVSGEYHHIAKFLERVAKLPRIVNVTTLSIAPNSKKTRGATVLIAKCEAVTYRFKDALDLNTYETEEGPNG